MSRQVFAHYMVGICDGQTQDQWAHEIQTAKAAGIDGFALNIGPSDYWTQPQLHNAYAAAEQVGGFVLFISFDMAAGNWSVQQVVDLVNTYKNSRAQLKVDGKPFVSTFEGPGWADNWNAVRQQTGGIFLVPDWSSLGAHGVAGKLGINDGAFSWGAWPQAGQTKMNTGEDIAYKQALQGKKYMMGVSPYFYTNLPQWSKNWYSSSESLWFDRWQHVLDIMPDFVEIITWNDYGESSYICDTNPRQVVQGADKYINGYDHSGFRAILPYFIQAYKAGNRNLPLNHEDKAVAWYRTTPAHCGSDGGTKWGQGGSNSAANGARDVISIVAATNGQKSVTVDIGGNAQTFTTQGDHPLSYFEMPFNDRQGPVTIKLNGKAKTGPAIQNSCPSCGHVIFNSVVINV
ncbi:Glycoside hydrolase [Coniochaeta hoffmannii]|uniref:Glycoside hydrolase n=1 Tax=Coniochaeta hoffmannii TaxID=91930 RepID=A0AA38S2D0_9PEZI|nr:Glycoside hydrolase [Coniochaeta hoffmannii]